MTVRDHKAIAIHPFGISRVVPQVLTPECDCDLCHAHGHTGMSGVSFLHSIHGQRAYRISHLGVNGSRSHVAKNAVELREI